MEKDLVIGIDSSTTATKATAWDRGGNLHAEGRESIAMDNPAPGLFEQNPADWWQSTATAITRLCGEIDPARIAGLAISNQRETFSVFDDNGNALHPGMVWLDTRAIRQTDAFAAAFGAEKIHAISGKPVDVVVPLNRMLWLREHAPDIFARIHKYAEVHCYLAYRLTGEWITSTASADPSGMLDVEAMTWSQPLLDAAGIPMAIMPGLKRPGEIIGRVHEDAAAATGLAPGTPVIAGGGDGQCAATGAGAIAASDAYMNLGTAVVAGVYSKTYKHDRAFRTETAVADDGYILETVLKSGTFLIDWFIREFCGGEGADREALLARLESEAKASPIGAGGIAVLPFWQGSMTPHWDAKAQGIIAGLSGSSRRGDIYRAILEGIALDQAFALEKAMTGKLSRIIAIGGGAASELWLRIIADACNVPVCRAKVPEASALGAAMCAAKAVGWFDSVLDACKSMRQDTTATTEPIAANVARYAEFRKIYDDLWPQLETWNTRLWDFADS